MTHPSASARSQNRRASARERPRAAIPLFTLTGTLMPVEMTLTYHSVSLFPTGARRPLGTGWTHTFNVSLSQVSPQRLLMVTPGGHNWFFDSSGPGVWTATVPASARDRIEAIGDEYLLTTLEGEQTRFELASGRWLSTTDRWGNTVQGQYDETGNLTGVVDALGRVTRFEYSDDILTGIALPGEETTWDRRPSPLGIDAVEGALL